MSAVRFVACLWVALSVSACSYQFRAYDGVLGFEGAAVPGTEVVKARYTEQANQDWRLLADQLRVGCGRLLGVPAEQVQLSLVTQAEGVIQVHQEVTVPEGWVSEGKALRPNTGFQERIYRSMPVRVLSADCRAGL